MFKKPILLIFLFIGLGIFLAAPLVSATFWDGDLMPMMIDDGEGGGGGGFPSFGVDFYDFEGIIFASWWQDDYRSTSADESLLRLVNTGADSVGILATWYMCGTGTVTPCTTTPETSCDYSTSNVIFPHPQKTPTDAALRHVIQQAKGYGRKVFLKLHVRVICRDAPFGTTWQDKWAGLIRPSAPAEWFNSYRDFANHYAQIAQEEGVDLFAFGTELPCMTAPDYDNRCAPVPGFDYAAEWDSVIDGIKAIYAGKITFSANQPTEWVRITFWDRCDYLGIGPYYSLTTSTELDPGLDRIIDGWRNSLEGGDLIQLFEQWSVQHGNKPVLFTELGYCSVNTATYRPWKGTQSWPENQALQKRAYDALFLALQNKPWFAGVFWWDWLTNPNAGTVGLERREYTPQNKLAQGSLENFFMGIDLSKVESIKIVDQGGIEIPDGTELKIGKTLNIYAIAKDAGGTSLGFAPVNWSVTGTGGTFASNRVGYGQLKTVSEGTLSLTARIVLPGRINTDSVRFSIIEFLRVPSRYLTIQAAANVAVPGDTILVARGTYPESVTLPRGVNLISEEGPFVTAIDASGYMDGLIGGELVSGFTIKNSNGRGIGRGFSNTTKRIINNIIRNNQAAGIDIYNATSLVSNNLILNNGLNPSNPYGGGVRIDAGARVTVVNNVIDGNKAWQGGGVYIAFSPNTVVLNNIITRNSGEYGSAIKVWSSCPQRIDFNDIWQNPTSRFEIDIGSCTLGPGSIAADPKYVDPATMDYHLQTIPSPSPAVDAGDPDPLYNDPNGTRNDMGAYGGPDGDW